MKKVLCLLLVMLLLMGCGKTEPGAKSEIDYRECRYIGIIFNEPEQSKEFWLAVNDSGNVLDAACSGWIAEFDPEACQGHYLEVFSNLYEQFNGEAFLSIFFGFAGMSPEMEDGFRTECKKFIGKLRPELPFETRSEDSDRAYQKFEDYWELKNKEGSQEQSPDVHNQPDPGENIARRDMEAGTEEEFLNRECRYIGIIFNEPEQSKEFWLAINDSGNVLDEACSGWIAEFDPEACQGHYLEVFSNLYEQFNGEACPSIFFGFAGMSPEMEDGFRTECKKFIGKLRPELPFEARSEDSDRAYQKFEDYWELKNKEGSQEQSPDVHNQPGPGENIAQRDMEAGTEEEFLKALTGAGAIVLKNDLTVDISDIRISDVTVNQIDGRGHALMLSGTYAVDDHYHTIEVNNASSIDISKLDVDISGFSTVNEEMEPNQLKLEALFRFNISYKNVALGVLPERKDLSGNPIVAECYADINDEGTAITVTVRRAQSVEARHRQETEYLEKYFENPGAYQKDGLSSRMKIYTDVELYLDNYDTPSDQEIMVEIEETGSLKLSGKVNITGPKVLIESVTKGSVDIRELTINRRCASPDCMWIFCYEGIDEELLTPADGLKNNSNAKLVVSISENQSAITIW